MFKITNLNRTIFFLTLDVISIYLAVFIAFILRFDFTIPIQYIDDMNNMALILIVLKTLLFYLGSVYKISWRHFSFRDSVLIMYHSIIVTTVFIIIVYLTRDGFLDGFPRSVIPIEFFISLSLILSSRMVKRFFLELFNRNALGIPTLVVATPRKANEITRKMLSSDKYWPVAIFDNHSSSTKINGVYTKTLKELEKYHAGLQQAIISDEFELEEMYEVLKHIGVKEFKKYNSEGGIEESFKDVTVEDLLARHPQDLDKEKIKTFIKDKTVLVTGAGGSIGSEICRQCELFGAKKLILLDNSEYNLYSIEQEIKSVESIAIMQSVVNRKSIEETFSLYKPDIVIHAAAYKHVPLVEANIYEGIVNNVIGTKNIIDLSIKYGVEKFVMISTDKAVRPTNVMGTTKRICELYAQNSNGNGTDIVAVRFGNVLGSSGSVIPKFKAQIQAGKNITVTHKDITRYFMLIPEACELVLQAGAIGTGGEIFILDMGEPIKIVDLAQKMIELSGKKDIQIEFTGLRPGEKLYEELLIDGTDCETDYESITVAKPTPYDLVELNKDIEELISCEDKLIKLKEIVPEFNHQLN